MGSSTDAKRSAEPGDPGPAEADRVALAGALLPFILRNCLALGVLAALAEICWTYLLPMIRPQWRALLPTGVGEWALFLAAGLATDVPLALLAGLLLWLIVAGLLRARGQAGGGRWRLILTRMVILGAMLSYLYVGWLGFFVVRVPQIETAAGWSLLAAGVVVMLLVSLGISVALARPRPARGWSAASKTWCVALGALIVASLVGFGHYRARGPVRAEPSIAVRSGGPRPNVLLVTLDTLRGDYLGCYGHPWIQTPTLDELAVHGVLFETGIAQAPQTCPSHCSIMTGMYPFDHDARWNGTPMKPGLITLAGVLRAHGYETIAFTSATPTRSIDSGLDRGFERYVDSLVPWSTVFSYDGFQRLIFFYLVGVAQRSQIRGEVVSDRAIAWLKSRRDDRPFFAWLHYFDPHDPYGSPPPFRGMYAGRIRDGRPAAAERERYAEDITYADHQLGRVIAELRGQGLYDQTLIIVTSDHGEAFGEQHGTVTEYGHLWYLYDTTQHVPLIIKPPGARLQARRVAEQVQLVDLAPTVLRYLDIDPPPSFVGTPLNDLLAGRPTTQPGERQAFSFSIRRYVAPEADGARGGYYQQLAVRTPAWKYITMPRVGHDELYDLRADPAERFEVSGQYPDVVAERSEHLRPFWDPEHDTGEHPRQRLAPRLISQLQALGYLGDDRQGVEEEDASGDD